MIEYACLCISVGILIEVYNRSDKMKAQDLARITQIDELKGLVDLLEKEPLSYPVVAIFGTVGSNSAVETTRSGTLCVFSEETATVCYKREKNCNTDSSREEYKNVMLYRKEVPWYLDDGTGRVYVTGAQFAKGFYDTLKRYIFTEPVTEHFERFFSFKDVQFVPNNCCEHVLEIGKPLTIIGKAERDKNGAPTIGRVYQVFNGPSINKIDELASDLKSISECCEMLSLLLTGIGVSIVAVSFLHNHLEFSK
ncbi:hypothetical protein YC2023_034374 [Brassica napus]|uniref:RING-type E3 ubiquitin transferase n=2 Tax=Brassica TaxID=3705 RepID=A0A816HXZ3_BRANA|nr:unnamed protein product [Brassica napus]VDC85898.1 unnamed protein product [Brassica oleracea]